MVSRASPTKSKGPQAKRAGALPTPGWTDTYLLHLLNNGFGSMRLITSALLVSDMPRPRVVYHLQILEQQVQFLSMVTQAWELQNLRKQGNLPWNLDLLQVHDLLVWTLQPYDQEALGIEVYCRPDLPQILGDRDWLKFTLRCLVLVAVMEGQRCRFHADSTARGKGIRLTIRRRGEILGSVSPTTIKLLQETCRWLIEKHGGSMTIHDRHLDDWWGVIELPWAGAQETP